VTPWTLPRLGWHAWRGARGSSVLVAHDADRLVIRCDGPMPLQTDGEDLGDVEEAIFEAERDAVAVLV
jgi:diacylglycerol kinase family enzyme